MSSHLPTCSLPRPDPWQLPFRKPLLSTSAISAFCFLLSALAIALLLSASAALADSVVVFNEIMYHPATNEPALEWVELYDQNSVDVDLSGWRIAGGIDYLFPDHTVIHGGGYLVVAISPVTLMATTGQTNVLGPFSGRLSNNGEKLELRDLNNRLMDSVTYGVDGAWPEGADGSGVSLAKKNPNLSSKPAANWTISAQNGGTPGTTNFSFAPRLGAQVELVSFTNQWRYDDTGADLGAVWQAPGFDDSAWASGSGLFFFGDAALPAPSNTPLTPGRNTYYFRTAFNLDDDPLNKLFSFRAIVDDGAIFYLNGFEIYRLNMPTGIVTYATTAAAPVGIAALSGPFNVFSQNLVVGTNIFSVELHQRSAATNVGLQFLPVSGYDIRWDGNEGQFFTPASPALAPTNAASATAGVDVFTTSNTNLASNLNDGRYGSSSSWSAATNDLAPTIILRFNQTISISSIAWGRDNGDTNEPACGGPCTDHALGSVNLQYTLATNPAVINMISSNPTNGWANIGTSRYLSAQPGFTPSLRHRFDFAALNGTPILATGVRLRLYGTNTFDEIEINPPAPPSFDAAFGLQLMATNLLPPMPPAPQIAFNEISAASSSTFWIEILNYGSTPFDLAGFIVSRGSGNSAPSYTFPSQDLPPGGIVSLAQAQLGFSAARGDKLFLYTPARFALLDATTVQTAPRARFPDGSGGWRSPLSPSPGVSNIVVLHDEIVFNEIMYHYPPFDAVPAVTSNATLLPITGVWRYNDTGADLGAGWTATAFDDSAWPSGPGLLYFSIGPLPAPPNTPLTPGRTTYYFRASFNFNGPASNQVLNLRPIIADGAVFYLNGTEVYRQNMPAGPVAYSTPASNAIGDAVYSGPVTLNASNLTQGLNILAVEVHQATAAATSFTGLVLSGGGLALVEEGPLGMTAPTNLARQQGAAPFVTDSLALAGDPVHDYRYLDDGIYGNVSSWIGNSGSPGYAGISFGGLFTISSFAFGRDNTGTHFDRTFGLYTWQYTRVTTP